MVDVHGFSIALFHYRRDITTFDPCWLQIDSLGALDSGPLFLGPFSANKNGELLYPDAIFQRSTGQNPNFPEFKHVKTPISQISTGFAEGDETLHWRCDRDGEMIWAWLEK